MDTVSFPAKVFEFTRSRHRAIVIVWTIILIPSVCLAPSAFTDFSYAINFEMNADNHAFKNIFPGEEMQSPFYVHVIAEDENIITDIRNLQVKRFMIDLADKASVSEFSDHILSLYENYFTVDTNGHHILAKRYLAHDLMSTYSSFRMTMNLTESFIQYDFHYALVRWTEELKEKHLNASYSINISGVFSAILDSQLGSLQSMKTIEIVAIPLTLLVMYSLLRSFRFLIIPGVATLLTLATAFAVLYLLFLSGMYLSVVITAMTAVSGMALSMDYALFIITRYFEEMHSGKSHEVSLKHAMIAAGEVIVVSGSVLVLCFLTLSTSSAGFVQGIGVSLCITAIAAIALSLTLIPAVMLTFPDFFINWVPKSRTQQPSHEEENEGLLGREAQRAKSGRESLWIRVTAFILTHRYVILVFMAISSILCGVYGFQIPVSARIKVGSTGSMQKIINRFDDSFGPGAYLPYTIVFLTNPSTEGAPKSAFTKEFFQLCQPILKDLMQVLPGTEVLGALHFNGSEIPFETWSEAINNQDGEANELARSLIELSNRLSNLPSADAYQNATAQQVVLTLPIDATSPEGHEWLRKARGIQSRIDVPIEVYIANGGTFLVDLVDGQLSYLIVSMTIAVVVVAVIIGIAFHSALIPLWTSASVMATLAWTLTALRIFFAEPMWQRRSLLGPGEVMWTGIVVTSFFVVGFAFDFDIFVLTRIMEYSEHGLSHFDSIKLAIERTGPVITTAALLMGISFAAMGIGGFVHDDGVFQQLGFALVFSLAFDAFVVRSVIVPVMMGIVSDIGYWPRRGLFLTGALSLKREDTRSSDKVV